MSTQSEVDLCDRLRDFAERQGFDVYPEVGGWDLVLVTNEPRTLGSRYRGVEVAPGEQVGIHAKLRANCDVLAQAMPGEFETHAPTWPMVAAPKTGSPFCYVARRLGLGVIEGVTLSGEPAVREVPRRSAGKPLHLPPVASRAIVAGAPSPRVLSPWRVKALRFLIGVRAAASQRFTVADVVAAGLSKTWAEHWGVAVDWTTQINKRGKAVRVRVYELTSKAEKLPDCGYRDVADELAAAEKASAA